MKLHITLIALLLCINLPACADLQGDIAGVLKDSLLVKADVGIVVLKLEPTGSPGRMIYAHNPDTPLITASNMKLLTTSAALDILGKDFRYQTLLVQRGQDLILIGDGDPMFGDADALRKLNWNITTVYTLWADKLKKAGRMHFQNVLVDDTVFDQEFMHPEWPANQRLDYYCAQIAGMTLNTGLIDFYITHRGAGNVVSYRTDPATSYVSVANSCVGGKQNAIVFDRANGSNKVILKGSATGTSTAPLSVTVHDPALYAGQVLAETLIATGITIAGGCGRDGNARRQLLQKDASVTVLAGCETTLEQVIARTNKESQNLYAESLCKRIGYATTGQSGSWASGTAAIGAFLKKAGAVEGSYKIDDGCGLSRKNAVSASAIAAALHYDFNGPNRDSFMETLAVAGVDGTLDKRFKGAGVGLRGRVFAKTGFINGVSALSGYLKAADGNYYAFSILMNGLPAYTNARAKELQEKIVLAIDRAAGK